MSATIHPTPAALVEELRKSMHEFNNTLTPILANAQLARVMIDDSDDDIREAMDDIVDAAERAKKLVQQMRQVAKDLQQNIDPGSAEDGSGRVDDHG